MRRLIPILSACLLGGALPALAQETQPAVETGDVPAATLDLPAEAQTTEPQAAEGGAVPPLAELRDSATKLAEQIRKALAAGKEPPLHSDLAASLLIYDAFNRDVLRTLPADLATVKATCTPVMEAGLGYGRYLVGKKTGADAAAAKIQDELALAFAAEDLCAKRTLALTAAGLEGKDKKALQAAAETVAPMRTGALRIEIGMLRAQSDEAVNQANKMLLLGALREEPETLAESLTLAQRRTLVDEIDAAAGKVEPGIADQLGQLKAYFTKESCTGLCAIGPATPKPMTVAAPVSGPVDKPAPPRKLDPGR